MVKLPYSGSMATNAVSLLVEPRLNRGSRLHVQGFGVLVPDSSPREGVGNQDERVVSCERPQSVETK